MASPPPYLVEDQTDEDFFDNLVGDDEFGATGSQPQAAEIARVLSNLSIGDGESLEDSGDLGFPEAEDQRKNGAPPGPEASNKVSEVKPPVETVSENGTPSSLVRKSGGSKVKEVQWSAFKSDVPQFDAGGFDSFSDFLADNADSSADFLKADNDFNSAFMENSAANSNTFVGSSEQQEAQFFSSGNEQVTDANDPQYWENLYPGWKYDATTGQWYQVDDISMNTEYDGYNASISHSDGQSAAMSSQSDGYGAAGAGVQKAFQDQVQSAGDGFVLDQRSDVSYLQQTSKSVVETVSEDSTAASFGGWNQVSRQNMEYPPNMVFDPQYPEWYYDTNTQQWHTLESYFESLQKTQDVVQDLLTHKAFHESPSNENSILYNGVKNSEQSTIQSHISQEMQGNWHGSVNSYAQQNLWQPEALESSAAGFVGNQQVGSQSSGPGLFGNQQVQNLYGSTGHVPNYTEQHVNYKTFEPVQKDGYGGSNNLTGFPSFVPSESIYQFNQPRPDKTLQAHLSQSYYGDERTANYSAQPFQVTAASYSQLPNAANEGRSSAGRPPHALVTFGFGGKIIVMKNADSFGTIDYGSQATSKSVISLLSLSEVVRDKVDDSGIMGGGCSYFHALCQQSFPGPLVGGSAGTKDVNKWIDEKVQHCQSSLVDQRKGELLKMLLSLLKISCQHYGKLRSPYGSDSSLEETDGPESDVTKLFASARRNNGHLGEYGSFTPCIQNLPSEEQMRATAIEVQNLLVSGRRKEALQRAQEGQLWGPALVLAAQLGEKFYVDTVKQMAHRQFILGSPLRTLCLLISGQPADVFSPANFAYNGAANAFQQPPNVVTNGMLDGWEENLAIITANRTKDDGLVIICLGDCLWKDRGEVTAAHACYLVAEASIESYSDKARLCLIGGDHWKCPRTYASPEAIQRTEIYEYSKVLGNSQFVLLPFQPYKLIYAYMLAELGKVSDSLRYCQASLKLLKNSSRAPEVENWKLLFSSLEERLRTHQQGGFGTNLAPANIVGLLFNSIDRSIHRMIGAPPAPLPPMVQSNGKDSNSVVPKVAGSQSTMAMSSLIPSASVETMSEWTGDCTRKIMHNRSISEPDFGRSPKQDPSKGSGSPDAQSKGSTSRFGRIGSQLLQKTMGWVSRSRSDRQAKLGESNKFYYDEKLKRWVEEGTEPPAEEAALPPPPTLSFQNGLPDYSLNSALTGQILNSNGGPETKPSVSDHSSGMPPIPPTANQFSARSRMGVRSRYVDTFNKGGGALTNSFQSHATTPVKPASGAKFFIPTTPAPSDERATNATESISEAVTSSEPSTFDVQEASFTSPRPPPSSIQRNQSMENIPPHGNKDQGSASESSNGPLSSRSRAASWCGSYSNAFNPKIAEVKPAGKLGMQPSFMPTDSSASHLSSSTLHDNGNFGDDLHEVEL